MIGTFLASEIRLVCRLVESRGLDPVRLLRDVGLDPALVEVPRARYPIDRVIRAWARVAELSGDPTIGLAVRDHYRATDFHGLAVVFLASQDLGTALERLARYHVVVNTAFTLSLERGAARASLFGPPLDADEEGRRVGEDARTAIFLDLCRSGAEGVLDPLEVSFTYPKPADVSRHEELLRCPLRFSQPRWSLDFRIEDLGRPFLASNRELARSNDQVLSRLVEGLRSDDLVSRVKMAMVDALASGSPSQGKVAKELSMSSRSLQRRLADLGTGFDDLLADVRRELAARYVEDATIPVTEIAYMLGFSDVSAFSRAFKRWNGVSPLAARAQSVTSKTTGAASPPSPSA